MQIEVFYEDNTAMAIEAKAVELGGNGRELRIYSDRRFEPKYAKGVLVNRSEDNPLTTLCNCVIDEYGPLLVISC